jgi:hypothetical protein
LKTPSTFTRLLLLLYGIAEERVTFGHGVHDIIANQAYLMDSLLSRTHPLQGHVEALISPRLSPRRCMAVYVITARFFWYKFEQQFRKKRI